MSKLAKNIVEEIIQDLQDRRGFRQVWDELKDSIREDIRSEWELIVKDEIEMQANGGS